MWCIFITRLLTSTRKIEIQKAQNIYGSLIAWMLGGLDAGKQKAERGLVLSLQAFWLPSFPADDHFVQGKVAQV
jgi:hypothetical protein